MTRRLVPLREDLVLLEHDLVFELVKCDACFAKRVGNLPISSYGGRFIVTVAEDSLHLQVLDQ